MLNPLKIFQAKRPQLREFDPSTIQRIDEGSNLAKVITETQVSARKCRFFAGNAVDQEVAKFFSAEADKLTKGARTLQEYYQSMTQE
ncbi:MAG: hypothetical protein C4570_07725 [Ammonifex sp.]|nr:MAG: hypothetical protein C4570_07725 [Ammonifex sp.]